MPERERLAAFRTSHLLASSRLQGGHREPRSMSSVASFEDRSPLRTGRHQQTRVMSPSVYPTANVESRGRRRPRATDRRIMTADRAVGRLCRVGRACVDGRVPPLHPGGGGGGPTPEEAQALSRQACPGSL